MPTRIESPTGAFPSAMRAFRILVAAVAAIALLSVGFAAAAPAERAEAAVASEFDPGYIMSDQVFYNSASLSESGIQAFLNSQVPTCRATTGPTCLRHYTQTTPNRAAVPNRCGAYAGGTAQSAARIIYRVAQACGISPKVLIVLLQKEQGLVTTTAPTSRQYRSATGYGCPDTAACDSTYYGYFNQVYMAALQFKRYQGSPGSWAYQAGRTNNILYHPNAACGTKPVYIRNQATAGLYLYTPYTPNAASLGNLYGTGDSCSSYGNRNFWRMYTDWFGSTKGDDSPYGQLTAVTGGYRSLKVSGWAGDPNTASPIRVHVYVDGVGRASVAAGGATAVHGATGFSATVGGLSPGDHRVCIYGINVGAGATRMLGCSTSRVPSGSPFGSFDSASAAGPNAISVRGWAVDPDVASSIRVHLYVDGKARASVAAAASRSDVGSTYPGFGNAHGFATTIGGVSAGSHQVCAYAINTGGGSTVRLGCRTVTMPSGPPRGEVQTLGSTAIGTIDVGGWAYDPDSVSPIRVHVYVDGAARASIGANRSDPGLSSKIPAAYGTAHRFATTISGVGPGSHSVCAYAINVGAGTNTRLLCRTVTMPSGSPVGSFDSAAGGPGTGQASVRGWALDPDTTASIRVHIYLDGSGYRSIAADAVRTDVGRVYTGMGDLHGFSASFTGVPSGPHELCAYAINASGAGGNVLLGCRDVVVP
ncbi:hypothetical protein [Agromyces seonyuensis]|uniref:Hemagglutinin n=1 Tax=Agromyces seonyuensis TaxID=2662446 RepID=A0A6I4P368_9MICO|nr:hypothetical protein [Agromyces seonyuensis]MWB99245.1 hypothetical protein [Agromyces seonyuensis]